jgi:hypothetical protein
VDAKQGWCEIHSRHYLDRHPSSSHPTGRLTNWMPHIESHVGMIQTKHDAVILIECTTQQVAEKRATGGSQKRNIDTKTDTRKRTNVENLTRSYTWAYKWTNLLKC